MKKIFPILLLAASTAAQAVVYDNGPFTNSGNLSLLQTSVTATPPAPAAGVHSVFGVGVNNAAGVVVADDFAVGGATVIEHVEIFQYQTGASSAVPTATGVFLEILNAAPSASGTPVAGSSGFANNLFASNLVSHAFTGVFRVQDTALAGTRRPIMSVKVALPTPVTLTAGVHWLQWSLTGLLASGPCCPPLAPLDQGATDNAEQRAGATAAWLPVVSGAVASPFAQGMPFRRLGSAGTPYAITQTATACGFTGITVEGSPSAGGYLRTNLSNVLGAGVIGYGFTNQPVTLCGCTIAHS
ncbi:MAG: hypothetical protein FJ306_07570 [Planctomycetes bacterium]|nr:hypothetical protein [Planctomycetota bacterium]